MDADYYCLKVHFSIFKWAYVKCIYWHRNEIVYTKDFDDAGDFGSYERAQEVAEFLENEPGIAYVEIIEG